MHKTANWWIDGWSLPPAFNYRLWHVFTFGQKKRLKSSFLDYIGCRMSPHLEKKKKGWNYGSLIQTGLEKLRV
jgi:hypothetical protein